MTTTETEFTQELHQHIFIATTPQRSWACLTDPALMQQWMSETVISVITTWEVGSPVIILSASHETGFRNTGTVLAFEPGKLLRYSHLSSLSNLPDTDENHTILEFRLTPEAGGTQLALTIRNFPTESIYRHFAFYWNVAIVLLKRFAER